MDCIIKGLSLEKEIRFTFVDVTKAAQTLVERHGLGPTAARVLGQALAGCALLTADLDTREESVQMQLNCDGPIQGFQVEVAASGDVRGYTRIKQLAQLDDKTSLTDEDILGSSGALTVIISTPSKVLYSGAVQVNPPDVRSALARYFNQSMQMPSGVEVCCQLTDGRLGRAMALVAQKMPSGDTEAFVQVLEAFHEKKVGRMLETRKEGESLWDVFGLDDAATTDTRPLQFGCRCSVDAVVNSLKSLETHEIQEIIDSTGTQEVTCHMCGEEYLVPEDTLLQILIERAQAQA